VGMFSVFIGEKCQTDVQSGLKPIIPFDLSTGWAEKWFAPICILQMQKSRSFFQCPGKL